MILKLSKVTKRRLTDRRSHTKYPIPNYKSISLDRFIYNNYLFQFYAIRPCLLISLPGDILRPKQNSGANS